jgi:hypothetical protein
MSLQVAPPSVEDCQFTIKPVWPDREIVALEPLQMGESEAEAAPPTDAVLTVTGRLLAEPVAQLLLGVTVTSPEVEPQLTVIEVVPWPEAILAPEGTAHVYAVAPPTALIE